MSESTPQYIKKPRDFALWNLVGETSSPVGCAFGRGTARCHSECSAISMKYLVETFACSRRMDLQFPHHENEIAQARLAGSCFQILDTQRILRSPPFNVEIDRQFLHVRDSRAGTRRFDPFLCCIGSYRNIEFYVEGLQERTTIDATKFRSLVRTRK